MFVHIVLWKLQEHADGRGKTDNARLIRERFEELANMVDGLQRLDIGTDVFHTDASADVSLYAEFESRAAYDAYVDLPAHKVLRVFTLAVSVERHIIDYEI